MMPITRPHWLRAIEVACLALGVVCLGWVGLGAARSAIEERGKRAAIEEAIAIAPPARPPAEALAPLAIGDPIGVLEIPRLGISEVVAEGEADSVLDAAIGHLPDTPVPWLTGNSALAAHRDTHFRPLRDIREGDEIRLRTPQGTLRYRVRDRWIVNPDDVWVLKPSQNRQLTLITCYPFNFIGNAPQRFVVRADAVEE